MDATYLWVAHRLNPGPVTHGDHTIWLDSDDAIGLLMNDEYEPGTEAVMRGLIRPGDTVLDLGAHIGYYTLLFAKLVGPKGRVIAFEPDPTNYSLLVRNVRENGYVNVECVNRAVSDSSRTGRLYLSPRTSGDHRTHAVRGRRAVPIEMTSIDDAIGDAKGLALVKMDIQGAEGLALRGMKKVLARNPSAALVIEFWPMGLRGHGTDPEALIVELRAMGFDVRQILPDGGTVAKAPAQYVRDSESQGAPNLLCLPPGGSRLAAAEKKVQKRSGRDR